MVFKWADGKGKNIGHRLLMAAFVLACLNHTWAISTFVLTEVATPANSAQQTKDTEQACSGPAFIAALNAIPATTFMAVSNLGPDKGRRHPCPVLCDRPGGAAASAFRHAQGMGLTVLDIAQFTLRDRCDLSAVDAVAHLDLHEAAPGLADHRVAIGGTAEDADETDLRHVQRVGVSCLLCDEGTRCLA